MCGFAGSLQKSNNQTADLIQQQLKIMAEALSHRGPDGEGFWFDREAGIGLCHRRLAVVDLSPAGVQPMLSNSARYVISYNGEIYNHLDLRKDLEQSGGGQPWRGHSDTETLLAAIEAWGIEATVKRAVGMFAFALWCKKTRTLTLVRDRIGEKPLYFGWQGQGQDRVFLFGSELKALRTHPAFERKVNRDALTYYLKHNNVGGTYSIYDGIQKLQPGCILTLSNDSQDLKLTPYWSAMEVALQGQRNPFIGSGIDAVDTVEDLLKDVVRQQLMSDVPVGAFLSGGVDSSMIVALMQSQSSKPVKTFSIGFDEQSFNEAHYASAVANYLGTDHTEVYMTAKDVMEIIPSLPLLYDEPFADASQLPTFMVSKLAREHVAVSLSGDGSDEIFCGYDRYRKANQYWNLLSKLPYSLRKFAGLLITRSNPAQWNKILTSFIRDGYSGFGEKINKYSYAMSSKLITDFYNCSMAHWHPADNLVIRNNSTHLNAREKDSNLNLLSNIESIMMHDLLKYLPDDILTKVDRASMGVGLETRMPFLDHRVVEFAWSLPLQYKLSGYQEKWIIRQAVSRYLPSKLIERPKMGFSVPLAQWLRGPLKDWANDLLSQSNLTQNAYFEPDSVRKKWKAHLSGQANWEHQLWGILMFQLWSRVG